MESNTAAQAIYDRSSYLGPLYLAWNILPYASTVWKQLTKGLLGMASLESYKHLGQVIIIQEILEKHYHRS